jgi:hypothetical protein
MSDDVEILTDDDVDGIFDDDLERVFELDGMLLDEAVSLDDDGVSLDDVDDSLDDEDSLLLSSDFSLGMLDSSSDESIIIGFFFGLSVIILYIMNIIYILATLY